MGNWVSQPDRDKKASSDLIDEQLEGDRKRSKKECKILVLGSGGSGKSTIFKLMKIAFQGGFTPEERDSYRGTIYKNVLDSAQAIALMMRKIGIQCADESNEALADRILGYRLEGPDEVLLSDIANAIHLFCQDGAILQLLDEHSSEFYLMDNAFYFFTEVLRIGAPGYWPTETDILHARATTRTLAITETKLPMGPLEIHMVGVSGHRSLCHKWIHCFESVTSIIFCAAVSDYDQVLSEDETQNRMAESLVLFESVINSRWFLRTSIVLLLNKFDVLKKKVSKIPLERYFPEFSGGNDINKAAKFILWRFMQANRARLSVYPHLTHVTDTSTARLVCSAVKETVLHNALKDSRILRNALEDLETL
ncbi:heterotrimeric G-protein alpha subunit, GPA3-like protein [Armillaria luteobubalina]|uniref:Heterotrimeric G-protein alpha subunit, GPA3-like protein n=1 Tax=Armillaria luteobubalina TaxID=153913 RepID=A0AA39UPG3_9AGAR|nr:heterotrimeric G-protein alpha subunit, GPA3-like protein [Armillaria luteobubalina]